MAERHGIFRHVAKMKRLLPLRNAATGSRDDPPGGLSRDIFPSGIKTLCSPEESAIDIVFVHGLTGNRDNTWTAQDATEPWPQTLLSSILTTARVLTFGYDAYVADWQGMVSQSRIANHAWNLLTSLASYRENDGTNERPILFVCHSLGGLVCEDALVTARQRTERHLQNILRSTRGIIFLGTPHHGAGLARWAELLSRSIGLVKQTNSNIVEVLRRDSEVLARIQDSFHTMVIARIKEGLPPIEITCFYEELPLLGVGLVVPQDSAILPGYIPIGIHGNHMDMTRFVSTDDPGFMAVCGELRQWIREINAAEKPHDNPPLSSNSDFEEQPSTANQSGNGNRQFNNCGPGTMKNVDGHYFEAKGDQNFVTNVQHIHAETSGPEVFRVIPFDRNEDVVHRTHIFARLDDLLPPTSECQSAALWGLGGSGKTQMALEYAYRHCHRNPACSVFWVHADNETTFAQDYKSIARKLGLDKLDGEKLLMAVRERLESDSERQWLLVLDNADDLTLFGVGGTFYDTLSGRPEESRSLYNYVPRGAGTVLWTSRDERIIGTLVGPRRGIQVGGMSPNEAISLLETFRDENVGSDEAIDAEELVEELQWLPLAISQAGAYLRRTSTPIKEYLSKIAAGKERWRLLKMMEFDRHRRPGVPNSVLETWSISIERIRLENEMAYRILHTIAYVNNQDIPSELLTAAGLFSDEGGKGEPEEDKYRVEEAVTRLKEFSFLGMRKDGRIVRSYEMHKFVQEATRYGLSVRNSEDEAYFSNAALQVIAKLFPERKREAWAECEKYVAHAVQVGEWAEICKKKVEVSNLLDRISNYLYDRGRWREKEPVDERAYKLRCEVLGEKHPDTISSISNLATTYHAQGRYDEADLIYIKVLELRREVLGEKHPHTISTMAFLAATYHTKGRYGEAESTYTKVLELQREAIGEKHPDTIRSMASLAMVYFTQGRYSKAEQMKIEVLKLRGEVLGEKHPHTISSMASLAIIYHAQGRYLRREVLGEKHPDTISSMASLATTYYAQGRYGEAESTYTKVLELQREAIGEKHPDTISSIADLATIYFEQGRHGESEPMYIQVLDLRRKILGEKHPHTISSMASLAIIYHAQGRYVEAEPIKIEVLELRREVLGEKHPDTISSMASLATTYYAQGRYGEAERIDIKVLELRQEVLGEKHPDTLQAMYDLAITWNRRGRLDDAIALMDACLQLRRTVLGLDHPSTKRSDQFLNHWKTGTFS
ncbi:hypothetical protein QBC43DRAFT_262507 [Cladorrhinum sp. PSN259]|nr:hypothetical protein QBC43DRAFT_262507 [Cladorrhinum sp. PSN259]